MGRYSYKCMAPGCGYMFVVYAGTLEEAVDMVVTEGESHIENYHPELPIMSEEKIRSIVTRGIKKIE